jgi:hypothetical protein
LEGLSRKSGDFSGASHGFPETSCNLRIDFCVVSGFADTWLFATVVFKAKETKRVRYKNTRRFLYDFPDPNPA